MNIFLLSYERKPYLHFREQAAFHCDKHVIKMIAETTQIIVTALSAPAFATSYRFPVMDAAQLPCKPLAAGHSKHPCVLWACSDITHVHYLVRLGIALCAEKARRYPIKADHEYEQWLHDLNQCFFQLGFEDYDPLPDDFPIAVKDAALRSIAAPHHKVVAIYRSYYVADKAGFATWRRPAIVPVWFVMMQEEAAAQQASKEQA